MNQTDSRPVIYSFLGPPGSGKGTLARFCGEKLGIKTLSTGDLCRKHIALSTELGKKIKDCIADGHLISDQLITDMVKGWLKEVDLSKDSIILDGYPRTQMQAELFLSFLHENHPDVLFVVISFEIPAEEIINRLEQRLVCKNKACQAIYSAAVPPRTSGVCDHCHSDLVRRADDKQEVVRERLKGYPAHRDALLDFYRSAHVSIETLDVAGLVPAQVFGSFRSISNRIVAL